MSTETPTQGKSLTEIIDVRKEKIKKIRELGFEPYEYNFERSHLTKDILDSYDEIAEKNVVRIAGRLMAIRNMGRANFIDIQDDEGKIQVYIQENKVGKLGFKLFKLLDIGDILGFSGTVTKTRTGQVTIFATEIKMLSKNIRPIPIVKEKDGDVFDAFSDKEQRYRQRYLDMIVNPSVKDVFKKRSKIIQWTRDYLNNSGYLEVETPILQPIYGGANARPFKTFYNALNSNFYLRIALELYLKRLIVGGIDKVYEISKTFRNEGVDRSHNPEFTLLEFYETYVDYNYMMDFVENYFRFLCEKLGKTDFMYNNHNIDFSQPFQRRSMFNLLEEYVGQDLSNSTEEELKKVCKEKGISLKDSDNYGNYLAYLFDEFVEPNLIQPTFVMDFPEAISPFAKPKRGGAKGIVERFELFIAGQEFVNSFSELNDPIDQRVRLENQERLQESGDEEAHQMDEDFVRAVETGMPPTGGVGVGIDRVVMLLTGQNSIRDVLFFPQMRS